MRTESPAAVPAEAQPPGLRSWAGREAKTLGGAAGTLALNVSTTAVNFVLTFVLARVLGASGYGAYAFAAAWASVLSVPAVLGLTPLVIRHVAAYVVHSQWSLLRGLLERTNRTVLVTSLATVALAAGIGVAAEHGNRALLTPYLIALPLVPLVSLTTLRQAAMQGLSRVLLGRVPETLVAPVLFLAAVVVAHELGAGLTPGWAMSLNVASGVVAFALGVVLLVRVLPAEVRSARPEYDTGRWARSALPLLLLSAVMALNAQLGTILVGAISGASDAGVYNVAARTASFISFIWLAASYAVTPRVATLHAAGDREALQTLLTRSARVITGCALAVALVVVTAAPTVLRIFGSTFGQGTTPLRILAAGELTNSLLGYGGLGLIMTGNETPMALSAVAGAVVNIALGFALVPHIGATGAAIATAAAAATWNLLFAVFLYRRTGFYSPAISLLRRRG